MVENWKTHETRLILSGILKLIITNLAAAAPIILIVIAVNPV